LLAQRSTGTVVPLARLPLADRLCGAAVDYLRYVAKAVWPAKLAMLYPMQKPPLAMALLAAAILIVVTAFAALSFRRRPYVMVGWLWFLGMLVPVIGLVQVGFQSIADRYMYVPLVGLSIALVWGVAEIAANRPGLRQPMGAASAVILIALAVVAYRQTEYWKDSVTLFRHTLAVTHGNYVIHNNLGIELQSAGRLDEAAAQFRQAVDAAPDYKEALNNLGAILDYRGNKTEAIALHRRAVAIDPNFVNARLNLGHELAQSGENQEAFKQLTEALRQQPDSARGHAYMGTLLIRLGDLEDARIHLESSLRFAPQNAGAQSDLCAVLQDLKRNGQALVVCNGAFRIRPDTANALNLGKALAATGQSQQAAAMFSRILAANPTNAAAREALANLTRAPDSKP
jgi:tetratricopeptide (TPR) repeat protein